MTHMHFSSKSQCGLWLALLMVAGCAQPALKPLEPLPPLPLRLDSCSMPVISATWPQEMDGPAEWQTTVSRPWKYIIIHHSASTSGNAAEFDKLHREKNGWDELGYHFVIDNGQGGPDGTVEVGSRWTSQKWGSHTGSAETNDYNNYGIGICLMGDFMRTDPTPAQRASLERLAGYLSSRYSIEPRNIIGHRDALGAKTQCPGDRLYEYIWKILRPQLQAASQPSRKAGG